MKQRCIIKYLSVLLFFVFAGCSSSNDENSPVPAVNENSYEVAEFCLRVYYPNENYTRFMNDFSYQKDVLDTLDFVVPPLYEGCIYEYRIYLSNRSWDAEKIHKDYLFKETKIVSACDSIKFVFPDDTIYSAKTTE